MGRRTLKTKLCDMLGIEYPVLSAGMGPALLGEAPGAPVELVVAVSEAGGCGVLGAAGFSLDELRENIRRIRALTDKPFGVDLLFPKSMVEASAAEEALEQQFADGSKLRLSTLVAGLPEAHRQWVERVQKELDLPEVEIAFDPRTCVTMPVRAARICVEERVPLLCAGLGSPGFIVEEARRVNTKVLAITGNARNAGKMAQEGIDLLVAQGHEAGGHTGRIGTMALIPQAIDAALGVPVLAAGGIGDGRGLAAALAMGCVGVWVGTRFLATTEGGALQVEKDRMVEASDEDTLVTRAYTGKTARTMRTLFHDVWDGSGLEPLPFPQQVMLASVLRNGFLAADRLDHFGGFAGQISGLIKEIKPAALVLQEMVEQAAEILATKLPAEVTVA